MTRFVRHVVVAVVGLGGVLALAAPAHALCTAQLTGAPAGRVSSCSTYAHGYLIVGVTGFANWSVACGSAVVGSGSVSTGSVVLAPTRSGGCTATMTLSAVTSGTTVYGVM